MKKQIIRTGYRKVTTTLPVDLIQKAEHYCIDNSIPLNALLIELLLQKFPSNS